VSYKAASFSQPVESLFLLEVDKKQQFTKDIYSSTDKLSKNVLKWLRLGLIS